MNVNINVKAERAKLGISSVVGPYKPPVWLKRKIIAAIKQLVEEHYSADTIHDAIDYREHIVHLFHDHLLAMLDEIHDVDIFQQLWDHVGRTKISGSECFVMEPYPNTDQHSWEKNLDFATAELANVLDCEVTWSQHSWHYPGHAYRILFHE